MGKLIAIPDGHAMLADFSSIEMEVMLSKAETGVSPTIFVQIASVGHKCSVIYVPEELETIDESLTSIAELAKEWIQRTTRNELLRLKESNSFVSQ